MTFEDEFLCVEKTLEFKGQSYNYREITIEDEINDIDLYLENNIYNGFKYKIYKLTKLITSPFNKEFINKVINIDKEWTELTTEQRFNLLMKSNSQGISNLVEAYENTEVKQETTLGN